MPGDGRSPLRVGGLEEFRRGLRRMDSDLPKVLRLALNDASGFLIKRIVPLIPRRTGKAAGSLQARSSQNSVRIAVGGRRAPYYPWLDFGGRTGRKGSARRPFLKDGRYIYPTYRQVRGEFADMVSEAVTKVAEQAGLEVD